jgi:lysophospholipase L1-like esterase
MRTHGLFALILATILGVGGVVPVSSQSTEATAYPLVASAVQSLTTAQDSSGSLWAAWEVDDGIDVEIYFSHQTGQEWLAPQAVQSRPDAWDRSPSLAITSDGTPWLAWSSAERVNPGVHEIYVSRWLGQGWSEPEAVPRGNILTEACALCGDATQPVLAAAPGGTLWLAWVGLDATGDQIYAQHWNGRSWSVPVRVSAEEQDPSLYDLQPRLAVGRDGLPWLVWTGHQSGVDDEIYASHLTAAGWTPEQMVSQDDRAVDGSPSVVVDSQGQPWVAWQGRVEDGTNSRLRILTSRWDSSRLAWTAEELASSPLSSQVDEVSPAFSLNGQGGLQLAWITTYGTQSAAAYVRREASGWTAAHVIRAGLRAYSEARLVTDQGKPTLLWLDPSSPQLPLASTVVKDTDEPLGAWIGGQSPQAQILNVDPFPNRYLAFGDSITWGQYPVDDPVQPPFYPYPSIVQDALQVRVTAASNVVNAGKPGEGTGQGANRIKLEVQDYRPKYVLIMEGTNDVSREIPPAEVYDNLLLMISNANRNSGVNDVRVMVATIIPRLDDRNPQTVQLNQQAIIPAANKKGVPVCNPWQAFNDVSSWQSLYWDDKHPNQGGIQLLADTFYDCIIGSFPAIQEESTPPTTWIEPLPAQSTCGQVVVQWTGTDNLSWVTDYDVQFQLNSGAWTDWLLATQDTSSAYGGGTAGDTAAFRVRGRDVVGNQSDYSAAVSTQIVDVTPPQSHVYSLPSVQVAPFTVRWWGTDDCSNVVAYDVEYRAGLAGTWQSWKSATSDTSGSFAPGSPQYGETYYFRARARDQAGLWSVWSDPAEAYTRLARFSIAGLVQNVRGQAVAAAQEIFSPAAMWTGNQPGGNFVAYVASAGNYNISVSRNNGFGTLPDMNGLPVNNHISGLRFILPPQDDAVSDGGFESGNLNAWQLGGTAVPALTSTAHTGLHAVRLGGVGVDSQLSQAITPGPAVTNPTLSFMVRLESAGAASTLRVELANGGSLSPPVTHDLTVNGEAWTHVWYDLSGQVGEPLTLTFSVSNHAPVLVDEVALGSSVNGGAWLYLPGISRNH